MGRQYGSYKDIGKSSRVGWLDNWKDAGVIKVWLHPSPPWERYLHNMRQIRTDETPKGVVSHVAWFPFTCWEAEEHHKLKRFGQARPAKLCPACRTIEHFEHREDLTNDDVILKYSAGKETRAISLLDFIGQGEGKMAYQDDASPKMDVVLAVIPADDPSSVKLTNVKWSLAKALRARIGTDIKLRGEDKGDPERSPICYLFEYDSDAQKYSVSHYSDQECTPAIRRLWESEAPDASAYVNGSDPTKLKESVVAACQVDGVPWDEIFAPSIKAWKEAHDGDEPEEEEKPARAEKSEPARGRGGRRTAEKMDARAEEPPPPSDEDAPPAHRTNGTTKHVEKPAEKRAKSKEKPAEKEPEKPAEKEPEKPTRPTKATTAPAKPETIYACGKCGGDWPESQPKCPNCGALPEGAEEAAPSGKW